jgi:hypothetical protein
MTRASRQALGWLAVGTLGFLAVPWYALRDSVLDTKQRPCVTARAEMTVLSPAQAVDALGVEPAEAEERYLR